MKLSVLIEGYFSYRTQVLGVSQHIFSIFLEFLKLVFYFPLDVKLRQEMTSGFP